MLAAGRAERFGSQKLRETVAGRPLLEHALDACAGLDTVVVASSALAPAIGAGFSRRVVLNDAPERGMNHSLQCALAAVDSRRAVLIVLGDMPFVDAGLVRQVVAAASEDVDVVVPVLDGRPVHPVLFAPRVRERLEALGEGDTIRTVRDDPALVRRELSVADPRLALDVDRPDDLERARTEMKNAADSLPASG